MKRVKLAMYYLAHFSESQISLKCYIQILKIFK